MARAARLSEVAVAGTCIASRLRAAARHMRSVSNVPIENAPVPLRVGVTPDTASVLPAAPERHLRALGSLWEPRTPLFRRGLLAAALAPGCIARRARGPPGDWKGHGGEQCDRSGIAERDSGMSGGRGRGARLALPRQGREPRPGAGQVRRVRPETLCHLHGARSAPLRCLHPSPLSLSRLRRPSRRSGTVDRDASRLLLLPLRGSS